MRRAYNGKWWDVEAGEIPLYVADMDLPFAPEIRKALTNHLEADTLMYPARGGRPGLSEVVSDRLGSRYGWNVEPNHILPLSATVPGLFLSVAALTGPGEGVLVQPPVYPPFYEAIRYTGRNIVSAPLAPPEYRVDRTVLEASLTPDVRALMICSPHNPTGRVYRRSEVETLATFALDHDLWIISDELHADLVLEGRHHPIAGLAPEVAERTVTLYGPTKAFNIAGIKISFAITRNDEARELMQHRARGSAAGPNTLAQTAALAAYRWGDPWLEGTLDYLRANRARLGEAIDALEGVTWHPPEGTYLAWLDFRRLGLDDPAEELRKGAGLVLSQGLGFGLEGEGRGFARLNFGTSRPILDAALARMKGVVEGASREA